MAPGPFASSTTEAATTAAAAATAAPAAAAGDALDAMVLITRYDPGNAAARLFMAGLGQAHIDGRLDFA
jgi:hypothetical protein